MEYQGIEAFVETNADVRIVYDFLVTGDGTNKYDLLPRDRKYATILVSELFAETLRRIAETLRRKAS